MSDAGYDSATCCKTGLRPATDAIPIMASLVRVRSLDALASAQAEDMFVSGLDRIDLLGGGMLRFVGYVEHSAREGGQIERLAAFRNIVMPAAALPDAIGKAILAMGRQVFVTPEGSLVLKH